MPRKGTRSGRLQVIGTCNPSTDKFGNIINFVVVECNCRTIRAITEKEWFEEPIDCGCDIRLVQIGNIFGKLKVIKYLPSIKSRNGKLVRFVECICECGTVISVNVNKLIRKEYIKSCGCLRDYRNVTIRKHIYKSTPIQASKMLVDLMRRIKSSSITKNLEMNISPEDIWHLLEEQEFRDYYTGVPFSDIFDFKAQKDKISIDRRDNSKGYTKDNVVLTFASLNLGRNRKPMLEFCYHLQRTYLKDNLNLQKRIKELEEDT